MKKKKKRYLKDVSLVVISTILVSALATQAMTITGTPQEIKDLTAPSAVGVDNVLGLNSILDETQTANFNNLSLQTDPDTSGNDGYHNFFIERMALANQSASGTILSVKNTWQIPLIVSDLQIFPIGTASTTLYFFSGTSTVSGTALGVATSSVPHALMNMGAIGTNASVPTGLLSSNTPSSTATGAAKDYSEILVLPGQYLQVVCRSNDTYASCLNANSGYSDIRVTARFKGVATSTVQY